MDKNYKPYVCIMTNSTCYKGTWKFEPKGVLWHSTGTNNWWVSKYVQPLKTDSNYEEAIAVLGKNKNGNDWNHIQKSAGLNCWIGKFANGEVHTVQTLPWNYRPWGCGAGSKGSLNDTAIQFEICEEFLINNRYHNKTADDVAYAQQVWDEAVRFTAWFCDRYGLDPLGTYKYKGMDIPVITDHRESWEYGCGSGHGDVKHWFPTVLGKTMEDARKEVYALMHEHHEEGWKKEGEYWYYYKDDKKVTGWQEIDGVTYYFADDGHMWVGWATFNDQKKYFGTNGAMAVGWKRIEDEWYYFDDKGAMYTSKWVLYKEKWYYLGEDGKMLKQTWLDYKGKKYYLKVDGAMAVNWKRLGRNWYFFDANGAMMTGWQTIDEAEYYLYPDGHMASCEWIEGKWLNKNGTYTYPYLAEWKSDEKGKWYEDESGWFAHNTTQKIDGIEYTFDKKGYVVEDTAKE